MVAYLIAYLVALAGTGRHSTAAMD